MPDTTPAASPPVTASEQQSILQRCRRALMGLGWEHPFFALAAARVRLVVEAVLPDHTMSVDLSGTIRIDPTFVTPSGQGGIPDEQIRGVLAHELCHLLLLHSARQQGREHRRWNCATDRAINITLRQAGVALPSWGLYPQPGDEALPAEQLYLKEPTSQDGGQGGQGGGQGQGQGQGQGPPRVGGGCGPNPAPEGTASPAEAQSAAEREWQEIAATSRILDTSRAVGVGGGKLFSSLLDFPPPKIRWDQVLRGQLSRALAAHGYDDVTYQRRNRRTQLTGPIFPGGVTYRAKVAVVIDTSGSMSDEDLTRCVANTIAIGKAMRVRLYLVTHDDGVQWQGWVEPGARHTDVAGKCRGRGGTTFGAAYEAVAQQGAFDAMIHLTDGGVGHWPAKPPNARRLIVALFGWGAEGAIPAGTKVIKTELSK